MRTVRRNFGCFYSAWELITFSEASFNVAIFDMAEHSFQVSMPNLSFFSYLFLGTSFLQESRFCSRILAEVCAVAMAMVLVKIKA